MTEKPQVGPKKSSKALFVPEVIKQKIGHIIRDEHVQVHKHVENRQGLYFPLHSIDFKEIAGIKM